MSDFWQGSDDWIDLEAESVAATNVPADDKIKAIADLAADQLRLEAEVRDAEVSLKDLQKQLEKVQKIELPLAMQAAGVNSFELTDGSLIKIKPEYYASISRENEHEAFSWLEDSGNGGIIKQEVKAVFGKGQNELAKQLLAELLPRFGAAVESKRSVHSSTLKAFAKEQLTKQEDPKYQGPRIPEQTFGVYKETIAKIDTKKVKR